METFGMERVGSITGTLFFMEVICTWWRLLSHSPAWTVNFLPNRNRSLPHRYSVNGYSGTGKSGKKGMRVSVSVGLGNRRKSVMNGFQYLFAIISGFGLPVLHGIFFHAHECSIRIGLGIELRSPRVSRWLSYSISLSRYPSSSWPASSFRRAFFSSLSLLQAGVPGLL